MEKSTLFLVASGSYLKNRKMDTFLKASLLFIGIDQGRVDQIWVIGNPEKLKWVNQILNDSEGVTE